MPKSSPYRVSLIDLAALQPELARHIDALARRAIEPNVFYESWMLGPALRHLQAPALKLVAVHHDADGLVGLFPLELTRYRGLPVPSLRSWRHDYLFLGTPLVAADHAPRTLQALLDWSLSRHAPAAIFEFDAVRMDGPLGAALRMALDDRPSFATRVVVRERALLDARADADTGVSHKHLKELRRQERRLAELGTLDYCALGVDDTPAAWIERFLSLEARGWKGQEQTALASMEGSRAYFREIAAQAHRRGQLQMLELSLDGTPLAMKCNFLGGDGAFAFKIAHDEEYAKYSPGVLLELFNMKHLPLACPQVAWMDSCAKTQHFMINRLWSQRRTIGDFTFCGRGLLARNLVRHGPRIARLRMIVGALPGSR